MEPADYAFLLAYKAWLESDAHYLRSLNSDPRQFNQEWLRNIGRVFLVNRTIQRNHENSTINAVINSGQCNEMDIMERAARLLAAMDRFNTNAASAISKYSWFIWPQGWTMFDRLARISVLGTSAGDTRAQFARFYVALSNRGWDHQLMGIRSVLRDQGEEPLLAERTIDKFLILKGMSHNERDRIAGLINTFLSLLPDDLSERISETSERVSEILNAGELLHTGSAESKNALNNAMLEFDVIKSGIV